MSVNVIDLSNEAVKEETPTLETIEKAKEEILEPEPTNEVVEEANEPPKEEVKEEKPKRQTQKDRIQFPKCLKEVSLKTYRYTLSKKTQVENCEINPIPIHDQKQNNKRNQNKLPNPLLKHITQRVVVEKK